MKITARLVFSCIVFLSLSLNAERAYESCVSEDGGNCILVKEITACLENPDSIPSVWAGESFEAWLLGDPVIVKNSSPETRLKGFFNLKKETYCYEYTIVCDGEKIYYSVQATEDIISTKNNYWATLAIICLFVLALIIGLRIILDLNRKTYLVLSLTFLGFLAGLGATVLIGIILARFFTLQEWMTATLLFSLVLLFSFVGLAVGLIINYSKPDTRKRVGKKEVWSSSILLFLVFIILCAVFKGLGIAILLLFSEVAALILIVFILIVEKINSRPRKRRAAQKIPEPPNYKGDQTQV
jgi:hypothetical protein